MTHRVLDPVEQLPSGSDGYEQIGDPLSPYLRTDEAARFLRFDSAHLFRKWAVRNRVPVCRRGRTLLYQRSVLSAFVDGKAWTKLRRVR